MWNQWKESLDIFLEFVECILVLILINIWSDWCQRPGRHDAVTGMWTSRDQWGWLWEPFQMHMSVCPWKSLECGDYQRSYGRRQKSQFWFIRRKREEGKWWWLMHLHRQAPGCAVPWAEMAWTYHPHLHKWICNDNALQEVFIDFVWFSL